MVTDVTMFSSVPEPWTRHPWTVWWCNPTRSQLGLPTASRRSLALHRCFRTLHYPTIWLIFYQPSSAVDHMDPNIFILLDHCKIARSFFDVHDHHDRHDPATELQVLSAARLQPYQNESAYLALRWCTSSCHYRWCPSSLAKLANMTPICRGFRKFMVNPCKYNYDLML